MKLTLLRLSEGLHSSLWFIPAICALLAIVVAEGLIGLDHHIGQHQSTWFLYGGGADSARGFLSTIAASMLTFTGLVFSITMLVLQLASGQLSPRVMRTFLRDRNNQFVLGVDVATFVYALLVLREVRSGAVAGNEFVPALAVWVAFVLVLLSIGLFIYYINHMAQAIRAVTVIGSVAKETRAAIDRLYPQAIATEPAAPVPLPTTPPTAVVLSPGPSGVVTSVDEAQLLAEAETQGCIIALVPMPGDFVREGGPLLRVWGNRQDSDDATLTQSVGIATTRTMQQDVAFGFRQLVDIGERALSPGTNDPTTAVQVLDQLHDLLGRLVQRCFPAPARLSETGQLLLILPRPDWESYVMLALDELRQYGAGSIQIMRRLRFLLDDLRSIAPAARCSALDRQLALLDASITRAFPSTADQATARRRSPQGHGPLPADSPSGLP